MPDLSIINRMPGETLRAYEVFLHYLEMQKPAITRAYHEKFGGRSSTVYCWARRFNWEDRRARIMLYKTLQRLEVL